MKNNDENELSFFQKFKIYYDNIPGIRSGFKLLGYLVFFIVMIVIILIFSLFGNNNTNNGDTNTTYQEILEKELDHSIYTANITINDNKYIVTGEYGNSILTGTIETSSGVIKYKIKDYNVYEIKMDEEISNENLFGEINYKILLNDKLIDIIKKSAGIKIDGDTIIYKYENVNIDGITYKVEVSINNEKISTIKLYNDTITYDIVYNKI